MKEDDMADINKLDSGDKLPSFSITTTDGSKITLPDDLETDFGIVLFYRGHW
jgi:peroxiredoxin